MKPMTLRCPRCGWYLNRAVNGHCPICGLPLPETEPEHLTSVCRAIERILSRRHPERYWIVEVKEDDDKPAA